MKKMAFWKEKKIIKRIENIHLCLCHQCKSMDYFQQLPTLNDPKKYDMRGYFQNERTQYSSPVNYLILFNKTMMMIIKLLILVIVRITILIHCKFK